MFPESALFQFFFSSLRFVIFYKIYALKMTSSIKFKLAVLAEICKVKIHSGSPLAVIVPPKYRIFPFMYNCQVRLGHYLWYKVVVFNSLENSIVSSESAKSVDRFGTGSTM